MFYKSAILLCNSPYTYGEWCIYQFNKKCIFEWSNDIKQKSTSGILQYYFIITYNLHYSMKYLDSLCNDWLVKKLKCNMLVVVDLKNVCSIYISNKHFHHCEFIGKGVFDLIFSIKPITCNWLFFFFSTCYYQHIPQYKYKIYLWVQFLWD